MMVNGREISRSLGFKTVKPPQHVFPPSLHPSRSVRVPQMEEDGHQRDSKGYKIISIFTQNKWSISIKVCKAPIQSFLHLCTIHLHIMCKLIYCSAF